MDGPAGADDQVQEEASHVCLRQTAQEGVLFLEPCRVYSVGPGLRIGAPRLVGRVEDGASCSDFKDPGHAMSGRPALT
jgi:hypothetical protein